MSRWDDKASKDDGRCSCAQKKNRQKIFSLLACKNVLTFFVVDFISRASHPYFSTADPEHFWLAWSAEARAVPGRTRLEFTQGSPLLLSLADLAIYWPARLKTVPTDRKVGKKRRERGKKLTFLPSLVRLQSQEVSELDLQHCWPRQVWQ